MLPTYCLVTRYWTACISSVGNHFKVSGQGCTIGPVCLCICELAILSISSVPYIWSIWNAFSLLWQAGCFHNGKKSYMDWMALSHSLYTIIRYYTLTHARMEVLANVLHGIYWLDFDEHSYEGKHNHFTSQVVNRRVNISLRIIVGVMRNLFP